MGAGSSKPQEAFGIQPAVMPPTTELVIARRILLDALDALAPHRRSLILVGAQAVYLNVGDRPTLGVQPTTTDGDLVVDPRELADQPHLDQAMTAAGFTLLPDRHGNVTRAGIWAKPVDGQDQPVPVDLIVPRELSPAGSRSARIPPHAKMAAMSTRGLEVALIDRAARRIAALEPDDTRAITLNVAGPAALLVAKAYKLYERDRDAPDRLLPKDALDVVRLYQAVTPAITATQFATALDDPLVGSVAEEGLTYLRSLFSTSDAVGTRLAVEATIDVVDSDLIIQACTSYTRSLLDRLDS